MRRRAPVLAAATVVGLLAVAAVVTGTRADPPPVRSEVTALTAACPDNQVRTGLLTDMQVGDDVELAVSCLVDHGVVDAGAYRPDEVPTHAELAEALDRLGRLVGADAPPPAAPDAPVTRGELASSLHRLAREAGADGFEGRVDAFDDDEGLASESSIDALAAAGVATGRRTERSFEPRSPVTRAELATLLARTLDAFVAQGLAETPYDDDVAPVRVRLDQAGQLIIPGSELTGAVTGDRIASTAVRSPCVAEADADADDTAGAPGVQLAVATDPQAPIGRCPVTVAVTFDNGRTRAEPAFVVIPGFTARPELVHVERVTTGSVQSEVRFRYDQPARLVPENDPGRIRFTLTTYDVLGSHIATSVRQDGDGAVIATFGTRERPVGAAELLQVSYATAFTGAMVDAEGRPTPAGTALLNPRQLSSQAYAGPTWSADLLSVSRVRPDPRRPGAALVDFLFDSPLDAGAPPNERVYAYDVVLTDGTGRRCTAVDRLPQQRITVSCDGVAPTAAQVARGVLSAPGFGSDDPLAGSLLTRRPTAQPDVVSVEWGPAPDQVTFAFDEPVEVGTADRFLVQGPHPPLGGTGQRAEVLAADPTRVVVTLDGTGLERSTVATARGAAVFSQRTGRENLYEQALVPARETEELLAGRTLIPDLVAVRTTVGGSARYLYDGDLVPAGEGFRPVEDLRLYLPDGTELVCRGAQVVQAAGTEVLGGTELVCADYGVGTAAGPSATAQQVASATYATASYGTPPAARVVEGATR